MGNEKIRSISVIIPGYNEEKSIEKTITHSVKVLSGFFDKFEIIVIDDASIDDMGRIADKLSQRYPEVKVIHNKFNQGAGESLFTGFSIAEGDIVTHNAMDYAFHLEDLEKIIPYLKDFDVVVACRREYSGYSLYRKVISRINRILLSVLFGLNIRDYNFIQVYKKKILSSITPISRSTGFITPEMVIRAKDKGYRIKTVDLDYYERVEGKATSGSMHVIVRSTFDMLRFWVWRIGHRYQKRQEKK